MQESLALVGKCLGRPFRRLALVGLLLSGCLEAGQVRYLPAAELHVGAATVDITPDEPVALDGQRHVRISKHPATRIYASVLALESRDGERVLDQAIMVSCDLVAIRAGILAKVREKLAERVPGFDLQKLFLSATHTHTAPVTTAGKYALPESGILPPGEYAEWLTSRVADGVAEAWGARGPGKVAWGQSQAVIAQNRRPYYADGTAVMYGNPNSPAFRGIESYEDHNVDVLFFWDATDALIATAINVPCPAQEVGGSSAIHADFWDPTRRILREKHGQQLHVLAWTGASGDVTSRLAYGGAADERMRKLRGGVSRLDALARRIAAAWDEALEGARNDIRTDVVLEHRVREIDLPYRQVTPAERDAAIAEAVRYRDDPRQRWNHGWNQRVVDRYEAQQAGRQAPYLMELHALRLGDVAIATNDFELYTDYGVQIKARSPGIQTFVIQLAGPGTYLPTARAAAHGGYGAVIQSSQIGPDGGQVLVQRTVEALGEMWKP
ncbi:MAG: hypothetical protein J5I93_29405 [Pirellulaceae bacterium]|nr:hypothetical protein [Pirellulaceae bacterium]